MTTIYKFINNNKVRSFKVINNKVLTSLTISDTLVVNPTLEQFLESGWQLYVEAERKQPVINDAEEVQTVEVAEEQNDVKISEEQNATEENNETSEENNYSPVEGDDNETQEQVVEESVEEPTEEVNEETNNETVQTEETVNEE